MENYDEKENSIVLQRKGGNKGKVEQNEGGYSMKRKDGKKDYTLFADTGEYKLTFPGEFKLTLMKVKNEVETK